MASKVRMQSAGNARNRYPLVPVWQFSKTWQSVGRNVEWISRNSWNSQITRIVRLTLVTLRRGFREQCGQLRLANSHTTINSVCRISAQHNQLTSWYLWWHCHENLTFLSIITWCYDINPAPVGVTSAKRFIALILRDKIPKCPTHHHKSSHVLRGPRWNDSRLAETLFGRRQNTFELSDGFERIARSAVLSTYAPLGWEKTLLE